MPPKFSIITPTHCTDHLKETIDSVLENDFQDWEMHIVGNGPVTDISKFKVDERIHLSFYNGPIKIGAIKHEAFNLGIGKYLVELDHDDLLTPDCLTELDKAITEHNEPDFIFSNGVHFMDGTWESQTFDIRYGWRFKDFNYKGHTLKEMVSFKMNPSTLSHINTAPDKVRVWKRSFYKNIGGHDIDLPMLDDLELMQRSYIYGTNHHLDKCIHLYRVYRDNV